MKRKHTNHFVGSWKVEKHWRTLARQTIGIGWLQLPVKVKFFVCSCRMFVSALMIALLLQNSFFPYALNECVYCLSIEIDYTHININNGNGSNGL